MTIHAHQRPLAGQASPAPLRIRQNRWQDLTPPEIGRWTPRKTVSVVIPCFNGQDELDFTLAALSAQSYPLDLMQVLVVDDGSEPPLAVPEGLGDLDVQIIRQENSGFGAGRARATGAEAAGGEIILFLDSDIVACRAHVEAHARWHHLTPDAVTMGMRTFVDFDGLAAADVAEAIREDRLPEVLDGRPQQPHTWIEEFLALNDDLRSHHGELWRIAVGSSIAVGADLLAEAGGVPVFGIRGIEDTALGYRLFTYGGLFIPERTAHSWHQGQRFLEDPASRERTLLARQPVVANHLPVSRYRRPLSGRSYTVPAIAVEVPVDASTPEHEVTSCVNAVLAGDFHDLVVGVTGPPDALAVQRVKLWFAGDRRVTVATAEDWAAAHPETPFRVAIPPAAVVGRHTIRLIHQRLSPHDLGALHITVPGLDASTAMIEAVSVRALRRSRRLLADGEDPATLIGTLFGEKWIAGEEVDIARPGGAAGATAVRAGTPTGRYAGWDHTSLVNRLQTVETQLERLRRRRVVALLNALGKLKRARSAQDAGRALKAVARSLIRPR